MVIYLIMYMLYRHYVYRMADALKQAIGMLGAHFCNLLLAQLLPIHQIDHCIL